jgi:hypothetical protein
MKLYVDGQANMIQDADYDEDKDEVEAINETDDYDDHPEDTGFMVSDELNVNVDSIGHSKNQL